MSLCLVSELVPSSGIVSYMCDVILYRGMWSCILSLDWTSHQDMIFRVLTVAEKSLGMAFIENVWNMWLEFEPKQSNLEWRIKDSPEEVRSFLWKEWRVNAHQTKTTDVHHMPDFPCCRHHGSSPLKFHPSREHFVFQNYCFQKSH